MNRRSPLQRARACGGFLSAVTASLLMFSCSTPPILELDAASLQERCERDLAAVRTYRRGLRAVVDFVNAQPNLFPPQARPGNQMLRESEKTVVRHTWQRLLEYQLALDSMGNFHGHWHLVDSEPQRNLSFLITHSAFLAGYRFAIEFIRAVERDPTLSVVLDEPVPEIGLPGGTYKRYKFRVLNPGRATEFLALLTLYKLKEKQPYSEINVGVVEDAEYINHGQGLPPTLKNAGDIVRRWGFAAWFPVQAGVSEWLGNTKVARHGRGLISGAQITSLRQMLEPGDVLLTRREWYLSNVGLPGFWPHAALYVGTPEERRLYFDDSAVRAWAAQQGEADGDFEALLRSRYPEAYDLSLVPQEDAQLPRVIEAISEGVSFTTIEHSAAADTLVALRPRLGKAEKARAVLRAFRFSGRPYDFDFSFLTDDTIVCTELVYKSYEPDPTNGISGIEFPLTTVLGRPVMPANLIVRQFDEVFGKPGQQLDLVQFLDGHEREDQAVVETVEVFRGSWKRPKWHIFVQERLPE